MPIRLVINVILSVRVDIVMKMVLVYPVLKDNFTIKMNVFLCALQELMKIKRMEYASNIKDMLYKYYL